ncbi:MAG: Unknown protein [uncultured Sulfurovum sp.]|uniref:Peptidase C14 caspase domain-containing protein n=1 Tax=uncultured Sulfurovum sp. TaxID=269237 RepID=A0A6S6U5U5_9BACT|nr:MAG: Unknown protein [uncultured Sulfurovum sp.]
MLKKIILLLTLCISILPAQMHSLVIGVNNGNLIGAENDAVAMNQLLANKGVQYRQQLYGTNATAKNIIDAFQKIVDNAKENDWVYLFFSGHGSSPFDPGNIHKPQLKKRLEGTGALLTGDNQYLVIKESLAPLFRTLDVNNVRTVVIFDACFSGSAYKNVFNSPSNLPFYTPKPTRRGTYPYEHLIYLSSTTYSDYASESSIDKRGYFSMAITRCLANNHKRNSINSCLYDIKNNDGKLPQKPIILPKNNFTVFPSYTKDIRISPTHFSLKEQLFNLATPSKDFQLYAQNSQGITSKNYPIGEKFSIHLESKRAGYFVLFKMGESNRLELSYPNNQKMPYVNANTNKKILALTSTSPVGEEMLSAFVVNKSTALALQKLYNQTNGELSKVADIKKAMNLIESNQIVGSKLLWVSREM